MVVPSVILWVIIRMRSFCDLFMRFANTSRILWHFLRALSLSFLVLLPVLSLRTRSVSSFVLLFLRLPPLPPLRLFLFPLCLPLRGPCVLPLLLRQQYLRGCGFCGFSSRCFSFLRSRGGPSKFVLSVHILFPSGSSVFLCPGFQFGFYCGYGFYSFVAGFGVGIFLVIGFSVIFFFACLGSLLFQLGVRALGVPLTLHRISAYFIMSCVHR